MDIKRECKAVIEYGMLDSIVYYFTEYKEQRKEFSKEFREQFNLLLDDLEKELDN